MSITRRDFTKGSMLAAGLVGLGSMSARAQDVTAAEARAIAKEAYVYGFPLVDNHRIQHAYFVDTKEALNALCCGGEIGVFDSFLQA